MLRALCPNISIITTFEPRLAVESSPGIHLFTLSFVCLCIFEWKSTRALVGPCLAADSSVAASE